MRFAYTTSLIALTTALAASSSALAQTANTSPSNVNILNLLSPYLNLNATTVGQQTLSQNLSQAIAVNNGASVTIQALGESDENLLGAISNTLRTAPAGGTTATTFGIAANLGGGLPNQAVPAGGTIAPSQPVGGLGAVLGAAYVNGVNPTTGSLTAVQTLLNNAYTNFTSKDLGVAKAYFSDGSYSNTTNGTTAASGAATAAPAVAPAGYTLPTANGLPNVTNSVYDLAYGVTNTQSGQDVYGSSRPDQVAASRINSFDPTALSGLSTNPSFPSGHTTYAYTDSILLGMLVPQEYQSMLYRASAYANSRIVVGVHYPLDIIGSRALASYDLAQAFTNAAYQTGTATTVPGATTSIVNLPANFNAAQAQLTPYLTSASTTAGCGTTIAACATSAANTANDPYAVSAANAATYTSNLTYGLPTLTYAQAPREAAPAGGPDASILLEPIYGGTTPAAAAIATATTNGGTQAVGISGSLATATINQIIINTETNALAAFYGTSLSYWTRIDLAAAAGYFGAVTGTITLASTDQVNTNVVVAGQTTNVNGDIMPAGVLAGTGTVNGSVLVQSGGTLSPGSAASPYGTLAINGPLAFAAGSTYAVAVSPTASNSTNVTGAATLGGAVNVAAGNGFYLPQQRYTILTATGGVTGSFSSATTNLAFLAPSLSYDATDAYLSLQAVPFNSVAQTGNQNNVGIALTRASQTMPGPDGAAIIANLQQLTAAQGRAQLDQFSGAGIAATQNAAFHAGSAFAGVISDQIALWGSNSPNDPNGITVGGQMPATVSQYATLPTVKSPIVTHDPVAAPRTWRIWGSGFGGGTSISGNATLGTAAETGSFYGGAVGLDYQLQPNWLVGIAGGGNAATFNVATLGTSGRVDGFHIGLYSAMTFGAGFYGQSTTSFADYANHTTRFVAGFGAIGPAIETGAFGSTEIRERLEVGRHYDLGSLTLTPFAALEIAALRSNGFTESNAGGLGNPALVVSGGQQASVPAFLGARLDGSYAVGNGIALMPVVSLAWLHEFAPERNIQAGFVSLPGAAFLVSGARPARDAAATKAGLQLAFANGVALFADFDGEFSGVSQVYSGRGGVKFTW